MGYIGKVNPKHSCSEMQKEACSKGAQTLLPSLILTEPNLTVANSKSQASAH